MNTSDMKNMVVIKNLPSNIIEEAIIILKRNQKIKKNIYIPKENGEKCVRNQNDDNYIIKEAELIINKYISNLEGKNKTLENKLNQKYKRLKGITFILCIICWIQMVILI